MTEVAIARGERARRQTRSFNADGLQPSSRGLRRLAWVLGIVLVAIPPVLIFTPWQQNVAAKGKVLAFNPIDRPQLILAPVEGRVTDVKVIEGQRVEKDQILVEMADLDDQLQMRLLTQVRIAEDKVRAAKGSVESYELQLGSLTAYRDVAIAVARAEFATAQQKVEVARQKEEASIQKVEAADQKVGAAQQKVAANRQKVEGARAELAVAQADLDQKQQDYERVKGLYEQGLKSQREFQVKERDFLSAKAKRQGAEAKVEEAEANVKEAEAAVKEAQANRKEMAALAKEAAAKVLEATRQAEAKEGSIAKVINETKAKLEDVQSKLEEARGKVATSEKELQDTQSKLAKQSTQTVKAPRDGVIFRVYGANRAALVKKGDPLLELVPETDDLAVELKVLGNDMPWVKPGARVRLNFEGWPAVQWVGWPSVAIGTYGGIVKAVDARDDGKGKFRILVGPDPDDVPWPGFDEDGKLLATSDGSLPPGVRQLRQGVRTKGWVLLQEVSLGYEIWRQLNGFPPSTEQQEAPKMGKAK